METELSTDARPVRAWFATYTATRHEKKVAEYLAGKEIEHYMPLYRDRHRWGKNNVDLRLPLFPNYLFVHLACGEHGRVLNVPGVIAVLGCGREHFPVPDVYIHALREGEREHKIEPYTQLAIGDRVRIICGAMAGMEGVLVRKRNEFRVVLTLEMLRRSVAVEVDASHLELVLPPAIEGVGNAGAGALPGTSLL
jgi:transcription antitermination factor NusG